jgi:type II secretory pathway pseudopilin PulG
MKKKNLQKRSAFSLVELAIVIIIIGLLVSGVMGGASLIKSATLRTLVSEAQNYKVGANAFYTKYNFYPGDFTKQLYDKAPEGNGDGVISNGVNGSEVVESVLAIGHLYTDNSLDSSLFNQNSYTTIKSDDTEGPTALSASGTGIDKAPRGKMSNSIWVIGNDETTSTDGANVNTSPRNVIFFTKEFNTQGAITDDVNEGRDLSAILSGGILNYADSLAVDAMIDDGDLQKGFVQERRGTDQECSPGQGSTKCSLSFDLEFFNRNE